jgi:hypothetical protein
MNLPVPTEVFEYFARDPLGPMRNVSRAIREAPEAVVWRLNLLLDAIPKDEVLEVQRDAIFRHVGGRTPDADHAARIWIAERCLSEEISRRKLMIIRNEVQSPRPAPYDLPAIADVPVDADHLVPLSEFQYDGSRLLRNGYAFRALTTTSAPHSSYWLLATLFSENLASRASVRLDPFLFGPSNEFPDIGYKMWMYGKPLDWERFRHLRQPDFGRWLPDSPSHRSEFTDFCWTPRSDGVHFFAEEVPKAPRCISEPSRYLHAIYDPASERIEHFDGALRIFSSEEIGHRHESHVRNGGKLGVREKVFRTHEPIPRDAFSAVVQAFFVWNEDILRYFTLDLALPDAPLA